MLCPKDPELEGTWRLLLQRQSRSGLSVSKFCAREGVTCFLFQSWKRRLAVRSLPPRPDPQLFVPLHLLSPGTEDGQAPWRGVELELPNLVRLEWHSTYSKPR